MTLVVASGRVGEAQDHPRWTEEGDLRHFPQPSETKAEKQVKEVTPPSPPLPGLVGPIA